MQARFHTFTLLCVSLNSQVFDARLFKRRASRMVSLSNNNHTEIRRINAASRFVYDLIRLTFRVFVNNQTRLSFLFIPRGQK